MSNKIPLICVVGPTASGKTSLSIDIAENLNGEIISADSMQIYRGIHIASAAPDENEKKGIPHHLIEFLDIGQSFTVADYVELAAEKIEDIYSRGKMPILVGGTGLYIDSLVDNIKFAETESSRAVREKFEDELKLYGNDFLLDKLQKIDPETADKLHPNNTRRIIRALELYELTGKPFSQLLEESKSEKSPYNPCFIGISFLDRQKLYDRIERRIDIMLDNGLLEEAYRVYKTNNLGGAGQAIGHKELYPYFDGIISRDEAVENLKRATRRYAKRQLTWFKRNEAINWIYADGTQDISKEALKIIEKWRNEL